MRVSAARRFSHEEREHWRQDRRGPSARVVHRYLNCQRPFDPEQSPLHALFRQADALETTMRGFVGMYVECAGTKRMDKWAAAAHAMIDLAAIMGDA